MYCTACGTKNGTDANFCKQCGRGIERSAKRPLSEEEFALPTTPEEQGLKYLEEAFAASDKGEIDAAVALCKQALEQIPESTDAHSLLSSLYEKQGMIEQAITAREKVLSLNPGSIADREKLEQLRDGPLQVMPQKVTDTRRLPAATLFDNPGSTFIGIIGATILVVLLGTWFVWARGNNSEEKHAATNSADNQAPTSYTANMPQGYDPNAGQQGYSYVQPNNQYNPNMNEQYQYQQPVNQTPIQRNNPDTSAMQQSRQVAPASVYTPSVPPMERSQPASEPKRISAGNTVHLESEPAAPHTETPPARNPGKIEIIVSPGGGASSPNRTTSNNPNAANNESRQQIQTAQQAQLSGNYRVAARAYIKALDGAGDSGATIQQQIGLCYQRLDDKESAIAHYGDAIAAYKAQISAGRNVESANRGIKACEAGIRACQ